jgi:hypothetical protein
VALEEPKATVELPLVTTPSEAVASTRIVLTYTLETIEPEAITPVVAVAADKPRSLKKVAALMGKAKNGESPLGGLRQAKDELFAFDLRKKSTTKKQ